MPVGNDLSDRASECEITQLTKRLTWEDSRGTNMSVIVCHFTRLISANDHHCIDELKNVARVSDASISMSNGCHWSM